MKKLQINYKKTLFFTIIAIILLFTMLISLSISSTVYAASSEELQSQINSIENQQRTLRNRVKDLEKQKNENVSEIKDMVAQKAILDQQASALYEQIKLVDEKIKNQSQLIANKQDELDAANEELLILRVKNKERIRAMEANSNISYWSVIFKANSFADLLDRLHMINEIAESDKRRIDELYSAAQNVEFAQKDLMEEKANMDKQKKELSVLEEEMKKKQQDAAEILMDLVGKGEEFEQYMHQAENDLLKLEAELATTKKEYDEAKRQEYLDYINSMSNNSNKNESDDKKNESNDDNSDKNDNPSNGNTTESDKSDKDTSDKTENKEEDKKPSDNSNTAVNDRWVSPCSYVKVTSPFGYRTHPIYGDRRMHNGVDLASWCPTPIVAARGGVVTISGWNDSAGYYVKIDHLDGFSSVYMHMCKNPSVKVGDVVVAGQKIGCMGTTGASTGVHLHFGIQYNGTYVDPMKYI